MIKRVYGTDHYIMIMGFEKVEISDVDSFLEKIKSRVDVDFQVFNADSIAGFDHLYFSFLNALKAFTDGTNISRKLSTELIIYASAGKQIKRAYEMLGIKPGILNIAILLSSNDLEKLKKSAKEIETILGGKRNDRVIEVRDENIPHLRRLFNIGDLELECRKEFGEKRAITDLIIERVALTAIRKRE